MQRKAFFVIIVLSLFPILSILSPLHGNLAVITPDALAAGNLPLEQFAIYGDEEVELDEIADSIGIVGSNDEIEIDDGTSGVLSGDLRALDEIEIEGEIKIDGDLITNKRVDNDGDLEVTGTIVEDADLSPVDLPEISFSADGPSHNVPEYGALTLEPGSYGRVKVRKYASLYLSTGTYFLRELDTDPHVMVVIDLKDGPVTLNIEDELDIDDYVEILAHSGVSRDLTFNCEEGGTIDIEKYARVFGTIVAPRARVKFNRGSSIQGAVYAEKVKMDDESSFVFHNDQISPPPQPPPPPQVNYRSIGIETGVLDDSSLATIGLGDDTVTFENGSLPDNIGRGDKLILAPGTDTEEILFIRSRGGAGQLSLQSPAAAEHTAVTYVIVRAYTSIQDWEDDRQGNLVRENRVEVGVCYPDGPFAGDGDYALATIDGSITDAEHFMWLTVAESHRHYGIAASGVVLDGEDTSKYGIRIRDDYTRIEWLEIKRFRRRNGAAAVEVKDAEHVLCAQLLIHDFFSEDYSVAGIKGSDDSSFTARNCIIYDGDKAAIRLNDDDAAARVENCTIFGMHSRGIYEDDGVVTAINTIAMDSGREDFDIERGQQSYNLSSDDSAAGTGSIIHGSALDQFMSLAEGGEDLHLKQGADAIEAGSNLSAVSAIDIDGQIRPNGPAWDMGADEFQMVDNTAPVAEDDEAATDEDTFALIAVLDNDFDPDADALTVIGFTQAGNGTVEESSAGELKYTPDANFNGLDSFQYTIEDGYGALDDATVSITVNPVNDAPVADAGNDQEVMAGDTVDLDGGNSSDPDTGDVLTYDWEFISKPDKSQAVISNPGDGSASFVADAPGVYHVKLSVSDNHAAGSSDDVKITTAGTPQVTVPQVVHLARADAEAAIVSADLTVGNVSEVHDDVVPTDHVISQLPAAGEQVDPGTAVDLVVSLGPEIVNTPPQANDDFVFTDEEIPVFIPALDNDKDADNDPLTIIEFTQGSNGTVTTGGPEDLKYKPNPDFNGFDKFEYTISDGRGGSDSAEVTIQVNSVPDPPVAVDDSATVEEDKPEKIDVLANDSDGDDDDLTIVDVSDPDHGKAVIDNDFIIYTPDANFEGQDSFKYTISDGNSSDQTANVSITVKAVNDIPVADAGPDQTVSAGDTVTLDGSGSSDIEGTPLTFQWEFDSRPNGSAAMLSDPAAVNPTFTADLPGTYTLLLVVNDANEDSPSDSVDITAEDDGFTVTETKLAASDAQAGNGFGAAVAIEGDTAIAGPGSAYIYTRDASGWVEQAKLTAGDEVADDWLGTAVSISDDVALVGAYGDDDGGEDSGSAYIFEFDGVFWDEQDKLTASDAAAGDNFGYAVASRLDRSLVGAPGNDDGGLDSGSAYLFEFDGTAWSEQTKLTASDATAGDEFGIAVALDDNVALVGAPGNDGGAMDTGAAYLFAFNGSSWAQETKLTASDAAADDGFGRSVSISGNYAVVGAAGDDDAGAEAGAAYIFKFDGDAWFQQDKLVADDGKAGDGFGTSVGISGDYAVVGAAGDDDAGMDAGAVYIYKFDGSTWIIQAKLTAADTAAGDGFGGAVAIDGADIFTGAAGNDEDGADAGAAYIFTIETYHTVSIDADPQTIAPGESATLTWTSVNADSAIIEPGIGNVGPDGSQAVSPAETTTYTITATGAFGTSVDEATVFVTASPVQPPNYRFAGGLHHSLMLEEDGTVWAWGSNEYGQIGDGTSVYRLTPKQVRTLSDVVAVAAGSYHSLAARSDGTVWSWGINLNGQLGNGTTTNSSTPILVSGLSDVIAVAANGGSSQALRSDGTIWAWGNNDFGQLGDGTTTGRLAPVPVSGIGNITAISAAGSHTMALRSDGTLWAWGGNFDGTLGDGTTTHRYTPVQVIGLSDVAVMAAGSYHSMAVLSDGTLWVWGGNYYGQLGDGTTTRSLTPMQVSGLSDVAAVAAGFYHSLAVISDGSMRAFGRNNFGQLGDGTTTDRLTPVQVSGISDVITVAAGGYFSLALRSDDRLWAWGLNYSGQLGDGSRTPRYFPVQVSEPEPNAPPVADAGPDQAVLAGVSVNLDGSGSSDPDADPLTYQWSFLSQFPRAAPRLFPIPLLSTRTLRRISPALTRLSSLSMTAWWTAIRTP